MDTPRRSRTVARVAVICGLAELNYLGHHSMSRAITVLVIGLVAILLLPKLARRHPELIPRARTRWQTIRMRFLRLVGISGSILLAAGVVPLKAVPLAFAGYEAGVLLMATRRHARKGLKPRAALKAAVVEPAPPAVLVVARNELRIWRAVWLLIRPKRRAERGAHRVSYGSGERAVLWVVLSLMCLECPVLYVILRGTAFGTPVGILDLIALPYFVGLIGLTKAYPHLLYADRLVIRSSDRFRLEIPLANVASMHDDFRLLKASGIAMTGQALVVPDARTTNVRLVLNQPAETVYGAAHEVTFCVDERHRQRFR